MKDRPCRKSVGRQGAPWFYFDLLSDFFTESARNRQPDRDPIEALKDLETSSPRQRSWSPCAFPFVQVISLNFLDPKTAKSSVSSLKKVAKCSQWLEPVADDLSNRQHGHRENQCRGHPTSRTRRRVR